MNQILIDAVKKLKQQEIIKSDVDIARKTGYSKGLISKYLSGKEKASSSFMEKFREVFNMEHLNINGNNGDKEARHDVYNVRLKDERMGKIVLPADTQKDDVELMIEFLQLMLKSLK